jgi:hypothetical protein
MAAPFATTDALLRAEVQSKESNFLAHFSATGWQAESALSGASLGRTPLEGGGDTFDQRCLIDTLNATADPLRFQNFVYGARVAGSMGGYPFPATHTLRRAPKSSGNRAIFWLFSANCIPICNSSNGPARSLLEGTQ